MDGFATIGGALGAPPPYLTALAEGVEAIVRLSATETEAIALDIANGDTASAWALLKPRISAKTENHALWQLAYELLTLDGSAEALEQLSEQYAAIFGKLAPFALTQSDKAQPHGERRRWIRWPSELTAQNARDFVTHWPNNPSLHFDLADVRAIAPEAAAELTRALAEKLRAGGHLRWRGLENGILVLHAPNTLLSSAEEIQLLLLWLSAAKREEEAEALALEYALRFDSTPPDWCFNHDANQSAEEPGTTKLAPERDAAADNLLVLPAQMTEHHAIAILKRIQSAASTGTLPIPCEARRLQRWPFRSLVRLGHFIRRQATSPLQPTAQSVLLQLHHAPLWFQLVVPLAGLAPFLQFADNNASSQ
ncbi:hypothetical protein [Hydrogenophilus thiooxidans]|uniref:hypothetical protein n=1 Tax=Hydrogenophilus thiooxidans TaxID=2820326 RepID=UPI001C243D5B|nr:hypothetical protein [Hydrogenophilus thiooxidans]